MIFTVTFNPAVDYVVHLDELIIGATNRSGAEQMYIGGKGINVSKVLAELGIRSKALGFAAGFTGRAIEEGARKMGVKTDLIHLEEGCSRINVKIKADKAAFNKETEINGQGPVIPEKSINALFAKLDDLKEGDILVLAGSIPNTLPNDIYERILFRLSDRKIRVIVDAAGSLLLNVLKYGPFLVKPNDRELGEMFGVEIKSEDEIVFYARKLKEMGAVNVLVSMAGDGAVLVDEHGKVHKREACRGTVKNSVGAGDSMVAGFIAGLLEKPQSGDYEYALRLATAAGGATAFSDELAKKDEIFELLKQLQ